MWASGKYHPWTLKPLKPFFPKRHTYIQKEPIAIVQKCRNEGAIHKFTMTTPPEDSVWRKNCKYTGCSTGILIMAYYNPLIIWQYNPLYALNNHAFFHCSIVSLPSSSSLLSSTISYWFWTASQRPRLLQGSHKSRPYDKHGGVVNDSTRFFKKNTCREIKPIFDWTMIGGNLLSSKFPQQKLIISIGLGQEMEARHVWIHQLAALKILHDLPCFHPFTFRLATLVLDGRARLRNAYPPASWHTASRK